MHAMGGGEVLKTDVLGRVKTPKGRREKILDEFEKSGVSGRKFAELIEINYQTFATWAQKRRRERKPYPPVKTKGGAKPVQQLQWLEAVVEKAKPAGTGGLIIHLAGGTRMEIADANQAALAATLLRLLESKQSLSC